MFKNFIFIMALVVSVNSFALAKKISSNTLKIEEKSSSLEWLGKKVTGQHKGQIKLKSGKIVLKGNDLVGGEFHVDMASIMNTDISSKSYRKKLENHLNSKDFFDTENYKSARLVITDVIFGKGGIYNVSAKLTIKGITRPILFDADLIYEKKKVTMMGSLQFNRVKYGIKYKSGSIFKSLGDKVIYDEVTLKFKLHASK